MSLQTDDAMETDDSTSNNNEVQKIDGDPPKIVVDVEKADGLSPAKESSTGSKSIVSKTEEVQKVNVSSKVPKTIGPIAIPDSGESFSIQNPVATEPLEPPARAGEKRKMNEPITKYSSSMLDRKRPAHVQPESSSSNLSSCSKNANVGSSSEPLLLESIVDGEDRQNDGVDETTASVRAPVDTKDQSGDVDEKLAGEGEGIDIEKKIQRLLIDAWVKHPHPYDKQRKPYVADDQKTAKANFMKWFNLESRKFIIRGGKNDPQHGPGRIAEVKEYFGVLPADDIPNDWPNYAIEQEKELAPAAKNQSEAMNKEPVEEEKEDQEEATGNDPDHDRMDNTGNDPKIAQDEIIEVHEQQDMDTGDDQVEDDMHQDVVDDHEEDAPDEDQLLNEEPVELAIVAAPIKRGRGRPPGKKKKQPVKEVDPDAPKRGRGRPKGSTKKRRNAKVKVQALIAPENVNAQLRYPEEENAGDVQQALPNNNRN